MEWKYTKSFEPGLGISKSHFCCILLASASHKSSPCKNERLQGTRQKSMDPRSRILGAINAFSLPCLFMSIS